MVGLRLLVIMSLLILVDVYRVQKINCHVFVIAASYIDRFSKFSTGITQSAHAHTTAVSR